MDCSRWKYLVSLKCELIPPRVFEIRSFFICLQMVNILKNSKCMYSFTSCCVLPVPSLWVVLDYSWEVFFLNSGVTLVTCFFFSVCLFLDIKKQPFTVFKRKVSLLVLSLLSQMKPLDFEAYHLLDFSCRKHKLRSNFEGRINLSGSFTTLSVQNGRCVRIPHSSHEYIHDYPAEL